MNPSTALARVLVDELVRGGVTDAVLAPGSRSAPLAFALHRADAAGLLRLHVRIDERSAGFLALGLAKATGRPVPVVTTSGTATANLHPAVLEASHSGTALLLLTADRPPELRGTGANQTIDQVHLYGGAVRLFADVGVPEERSGQQAYWRGLTCRALSAALGDLGIAPGPVQLNIGLREPLVPDDAPAWPEPLEGRAGGAPWTSRVRAAPVAVPDDLPARTVVVLGDGADAAAALALATTRGWPVVAEPSSGAGASPLVLGVPDLVLSSPGWLDAHRPDRVLVVGRPTLSRAVGRLVAGTPSDVVAARGSWPDPVHSAARVLPAVPVATGQGPVDPTWAPAWEGAGAAAEAAAASAGLGDSDSPLTEPQVAEAVLAGLPEGGMLVVGSSKPVRDLSLTSPREGVRVLANRGVAGIDGMVSTAVGAALGHGAPSYALLGDLTFLHDANGLVLGPQEPRPDLTIVVVNNDGGAIFGLLEQGGPEHAEAFERVFGTPHGVDLASLCAATGTPHVLAGTREDLLDALRDAHRAEPGLRVVEVRTDRAAAVALDRAVRAAVARALS